MSKQNLLRINLLYFHFPSKFIPKLARQKSLIDILCVLEGVEWIYLA